jgi:hypothetical protein
MTLFLATDAAGAGAGNVFPQNGTVDLFSISHADLGDATHAGYGEAAPANNLVQVTYGRTDPGIPAQRLDALVNTDFGVNANHIDVIVVPCGGNFTLTDGTMVAGNGFTIPVGNAENPTASVLVVYDTSDNNGSGLCVRKVGDGSGTFALEEPSPVILYHELSHAFHLASGDPLSTAASGCTASPEEARAETDENDMRDQLGLPHRDATDHCGAAGCQSGSCCIVATIATGSPYSAEVNALRELRDGVLRRSECGYDFFAHLHADYYAFSPEVCRLMARTPNLTDTIRNQFVVPLAAALGLMRAYGIDRASEAELGDRFHRVVAANGQLAALTADDLAWGREALSPASSALAAPDVAAAASLLRARALPSEHVRWALIEPIAMMIEALTWRLDGATPEAIGRRLSRRFDDWGARLPITPVWGSLSKYAIRNELRFLEATLLRTREARVRFGARLVQTLDPERAALVERRWFGGRHA